MSPDSLPNVLICNIITNDVNKNLNPLHAALSVYYRRKKTIMHIHDYLAIAWETRIDQLYVTGMAFLCYRHCGLSHLLPRNKWTTTCLPWTNVVYMASGTTWVGYFAFVSIIATPWVDTRPVGMPSSASMLSAIT